MSVSSSFLPEIGLPQGAIMKRCWNRQQNLTGPIEDQPRRENPEATEGDPPEDREAPACARGGFGEFPDAGRAKQPVIVFGDTFAAIKLFAFRTTRGCFPQRVIEAMLLDERLHGQAGGG